MGQNVGVCFIKITLLGTGKMTQRGKALAVKPADKLWVDVSLLPNLERS